MTRQWLRWGSATVLLVAGAAPSGLQTAHPGERVGAVAGALAFGVLLALILRFAFLKVRRSPRPLWAPAVPAIGAAVLILAALGQASNRVSHQQSERVRLSQDLERACGRDVRPTFRELSRGFTYRPAPAEVQAKVQQQFSVLGPDHPPASRIVSRDGQPVGIVVALPSGASREDSEKGFRDAARAKGLATRDVPFAGRRLILLRSRAEVAVFEVTRCEIFLTVAVDEAGALRLHTAAAPS